MTPPLQGVRILEMSQAIAGPVAARTLGDLGAEIIKIEQPGVGDMSRRIGPHFLGGESAYYLNFNRNKKSVTIDLRTPEGPGSLPPARSRVRRGVRRIPAFGAGAPGTGLRIVEGNQPVHHLLLAVGLRARGAVP